MTYQSVFRLVLKFMFGCILAGCAIFQDPLKEPKNIDESLPDILTIRTLDDVNSIGFEWDSLSENPLVAGFAIAKSDEEGDSMIALIDNPFATHFYVDNLVPFTDYTFKIYVIGKNGKLSRPKVVKAKTSYIDPVENLFASKSLPRQIKIFWSPHSNPSIRSYVIQRQNKAGTFESIGEVSNRLFVEYFDRNLPDDATYRYRILAKNDNGYLSPPSRDVAGSTRKRAQAINNLVVSRNLQKSISISWNEPLNPPYPIKMYKIYASDELNGNYSQIGESNQNNFIENDLKDGQIRYYKISIIDNDDIEGDLTPTGFLGQALPLPPRPEIKTSIIRDNAIVITWEINSNRSYTFSVCKSGDNIQRVCFDNIIKKGFIDRDVQPGVQYVYEIYSDDVKNNIKSEASSPIRLSL